VSRTLTNALGIRKRLQVLARDLNFYPALIVSCSEGSPPPEGEMFNVVYVSPLCRRGKPSWVGAHVETDERFERRVTDAYKMYDENWPSDGAESGPRYDAEIDLGEGLVGRRIVFGDPLP
jgi:hypothetical protein